MRNNTLLQDVQMVQYLFGCSKQLQTVHGLFYGVERSLGSSRHELFAAVVCKMEITSREYYSFCVISFRVLGMSRSLSSM